jgi:diguanylate cyclase (GGDEF)-like protein
MINVIQKYKEHKRLSIYIILILSATLVLALCDSLKFYFQDEIRNVTATLIFSNFGYTIRPVCILLFIFLSGQKFRAKPTIILLIPLLFCFIVYSLPYFPQTRDAVYYYRQGEDGDLYWQSGNTFLRYTSHIVSFIFMCYLVYLSIRHIQTKHLSHAINIFICIIIVIVAVLIETVDDSGNIHVVNFSIAISTTFYYLYVYTERSKYDPLTGLFNRAMYYQDLPKFSRDITGIIQLDMNGLKYINDTFGHIEGDLSLEIIAQTISRYATRNMYVYRLGGDEFLIIALKESEEKVQNTINRIKHDLSKTAYSCAIGYSYRDDKSITVDELLKDSELKMYQDKDLFYQYSKIKRRESNEDDNPIDTENEQEPIDKE